MRSIDETFETFGKRVLWLGYAGEEDRSTLIVDLHNILLEFPGATAVLKVRPPDEKAAYPAVTETIDDKLHWSISDSDTAKEGRGELQLSLISPTGSKIKTAVAAMEISRSLPDGGQKPDRIDDWMENAEAARKKAEEAATKANTAASNADAKATLANNAATKADTATSNANTATNNANTATTKANAATSKANTAASNADTATSNANAATSKAKSAAEKAEAATSNANTATSNANAATNNANAATSKANTAAEKADTATSNANTATSKANTAAEKADTATSNANTATTNANEATSKAKSAAEKAEAAAEKADKARQNILIATETGNPVSASDAFSAPLCGLIVYGKSTQDGTPRPDNPVPIVSAGDGGTVAVKATGKNLLYIPDGKRTVRGVTITSENGIISISGTATEDGYVCLSIDPISIHGLALLSTNVSAPVAKLVSESWAVLLEQNKAKNIQETITRLCFVVKKGTNYDLNGINVQLELGSTATTYEPYHEQTLILQTPNGLPGISVTSGGNYTDPQGQQWVCDEVDLERGMKVQRIKCFKFPSSENFREKEAGNGLTRFGIVIDGIMDAHNGLPTSGAMCSSLAMGSKGSTYFMLNVFTIADRCFYISIENITKLEELQQYLQQSPMTLNAILATPIETPLTPAELAAYKALTTYAPNTVVQAADGVGLKLNYQRDVNIVIKNLEDAIASMTAT